MKYPSARVLVFAKAPVAGYAKTRLARALGPQGAANAHAELIHRTLRTATQERLAPTELWCSPDAGHAFFAACARRFPMTLRTQSEGDLGRRMAHAFEAVLTQRDGALIVGTDCPELSGADLARALERLTAGADAVLGPAEDGGYYLIGLRRPVPDLFVGVDWGSGRVLAQTRARLAAQGLDWHELPTRWDVDRLEDYRRWVGGGARRRSR